MRTRPPCPILFVSLMLVVGYFARDPAPSDTRQGQAMTQAADPLPGNAVISRR